MRSRSRLRRLRRSIRGRVWRLRRFIHRIWIGIMWTGVVLVGLSVVVIAASILAPNVVGFSAADSPLISGDDASEFSSDASPFNTTVVENRTVKRVNTVRSERGLPKYTRFRQLDALAEQHSTNMRDHDYYSHESPDGTPFSARADRHAPLCDPVSENIHRAPLDSNVQIHGSDQIVSTYSSDGLVEYLVRGWLNSEGHRENLLARDMQRVGISITISDGGEIYATMTFGGC